MTTTQQIEPVTLKPCPFCGEQCAGLVIDQGNKWAHYEPSCLEVRTGYKTGLDEPWRAEAAELWNRRTTPAPITTEQSSEIADRLERVTKWLHHGCSSWGVPQSDIRAIVAALTQGKPA